jgi:hypothetical protein
VRTADPSTPHSSFSNWIVCLKCNMGATIWMCFVTVCWVSLVQNSEMNFRHQWQNGSPEWNSFLPTDVSSYIILSSGPGEPQVWHVSGLGCCGDRSSLTHARLALQVVIDLASWLHHSPHLSASPSAMHTLQTRLLRLPCLASQCVHNVFTMFHTYVTCVPNLGAFCRTTWLAILRQDRFTKGLTMEIAPMHDGPRFSWRKRRENTLLHRKQQNPSKPIKTTKTINCPSNASNVLSHCIILASLGQHHSSYVPYLRPNNHTYLPCLVLCLPHLDTLTYIEWYIACPTMSAC